MTELTYFKPPAVLLSFISLVFTMLFGFVTSSEAQTVRKEDQKLSSVFLSFDSKADRQSRCGDAKGQHVILQLHNNTDTHINVGADFASALESQITENLTLAEGSIVRSLKSGAEVDLCYEVEGMYKQKGYNTHKKAKAPIPAVPYCSCSFRSNGKDMPYPHNIGFWIRPKEFIRFSVPAKYLKQNLKIYTEYSYPWEFNGGKSISNEPRHRVYFYFFDMPEI